MKYLLLSLLVLLAGCEERFRYPCQQPSNWGSPECQRPLCAVNGTCPDQLTKPEDRALVAAIEKELAGGLQVKN